MPSDGGRIVPDGFRIEVDDFHIDRHLVGMGRNAAYADRLARKSVTAAKLADFAAKLEAWKNTDQAQAAALAAVPKATTKRGKAARALFEWLAEYKQFARTQFKEQPAIAKRLLP